MLWELIVIFIGRWGFLVEFFLDLIKIGNINSVGEKNKLEIFLYKGWYDINWVR